MGRFPAKGFRTAKEAGLLFPSDLDVLVDTFVSVNIPCADKKYTQFTGILMGGTNTSKALNSKKIIREDRRFEEAEFYINLVSYTAFPLNPVNFRGYLVPINHGDQIVLGRKNYTFIDHSD